MLKIKRKQNKKKNSKKSVKIVNQLKSCLQQRNRLLVLTMKQLVHCLSLYDGLFKNLSFQTMINHKL